MRYSRLTEISSTTQMTDVFGGYNHNTRIAENEFFDMKNLTSSNYPVLSPRGRRGIHAYATQGTHSCNGLVEKNDELAYIDGTRLYLNGTAVTGFSVIDSPKQLISMGAYLIILPDKKYVNTQDLTDFGSIENSFTSSTTVSYAPCRIDGSTYARSTVSSSAPASPQNGDAWVDTSGSPHVLKIWNAQTTQWVTMATTYVKISAIDIAQGFSKYDGVRLEGLEPSQLEDLNGQTSVIYDIHHAGQGADDYIVVVGMLDQATTQSTAVTVSRRMPTMDFILESENRLWGCRYGEDADGNFVNEIYASKLGDFRNWSVFMGISTDSYAATVGSDGPFTGAVSHLGYPLFFKETCLHKIYGTLPSQYQIQTIACRGVMKGCGKSLAIVGEKLFYKSRNGIAVYDGSLPIEVSEPFGSDRYIGLDTSEGYDPLRCGAVAGSHQNKYYVSMKSEQDSKWYLFVYDSARGLWHKEDELRCDHFCSSHGELYYVDHKDKLIHTVMGSGTLDTADVEWYAESGMLCAETADGYNRSLERKYVSRINVRMKLDIRARVMFYISYDSMEDWEHIATVTGTSTKVFELPIRPRRCDHFRLRIEGIGHASILSLTKTIERGDT